MLYAMLIVKQPVLMAHFFFREYQICLATIAHTISVFFSLSWHTCYIAVFYFVLHFFSSAFEEHELAEIEMFANDTYNKNEIEQTTKQRRIIEKIVVDSNSVL